LPGTTTIISSAVATASSATISDISLSIPDIALRRLVASAAVAALAGVSASEEVSASVLAIGIILEAAVGGGVRSIACITLTILRLF
jgi:hypothetical protein